MFAVICLSALSTDSIKLKAELFQALKGPIVLWEFPINLDVAGRTDELGVGLVCKLPRDH